MPLKKILILGAGGHGKVLADLIDQIADWEAVGFLDDDPAKHRTRVLDIPVLGPTISLAATAEKAGATAVALGFGDNQVREEYFARALAAGLAVPNLTHPSAVVSRHAELGRGVVILAGAIVNPGAVIEDNVCLNTRAAVDHDCRVGAHALILPSAVLTGNVRIGRFATVGANLGGRNSRVAPRGGSRGWLRRGRHKRCRKRRSCGREPGPAAGSGSTRHPRLIRVGSISRPGPAPIRLRESPG